MKKKNVVILLLILSLFYTTNIFSGVTYAKDSYQVAPGIHYTNERINNTHNQALNMLSIDLANPYASVGLSAPRALNAIERTTQHGLRYQATRPLVIGAINGGFFYHNQPMNMVGINNQLYHAGEVYSGSDKYVNQPIAFAVNKNGRGVIDRYQLSMSYTYKNQKRPIHITNQKKYDNLTTLYTTTYPKNTTETNYSTEVVVQTDIAPSLTFGQTITGTVVDVKPMLEDRQVIIPEKGFVISASGTERAYLEQVEIGQKIDLSIDINDTFKGASFILASGPMLVQNGRVALTMDPNSLNARIRAPRTAVALDKTGKVVQYVTVDGRQPGYSTGMTLTEFAHYLRGLGVEHALNLDGGGSTTFAMRSPGKERLDVINRPSDGVERAVSTALIAQSHAPQAIFKDVMYGHWAFSSINTLANAKIISGYPNQFFKPNQSIQRGHATIMLTKHLNLSLTNLKDPGFKDVKISDPNYIYIAAVKHAGIISGKSANVFDQYAPMTRAELAVMLTKAFGISGSSGSHFKDVPSGHWAEKAINGLYEEGYISGYEDNTFRPNRYVTRAEFAAFINRFN